MLQAASPNSFYVHLHHKSYSMQKPDNRRTQEQMVSLINRIRFSAKKPIQIVVMNGLLLESLYTHDLIEQLPPTIKILVGPGNPLSFVSKDYIDKLLAYSRLENCIVTAYHEIMHLPSSSISLAEAIAEGADIQPVSTILEAMLIAKKNRPKSIVFSGFGFEPSTAATAGGIQRAYMAALLNFYVLPAHKRFLAPLHALLMQPNSHDGFIISSHIAESIGLENFDFIANNYKKALVVSGTTPVEVLQSILMVILQVENESPKVELQNPAQFSHDKAAVIRHMIDETFESSDEDYIGFGILTSAGFKFRNQYKSLDANTISLEHYETGQADTSCICNKILSMESSPTDCLNFKNKCSPETPKGACMADKEGACHLAYRISKS